ncbi:hypothetical protein HPP92_005831 [Vanilla planifolia]|uniref:Uncharacterized protein n=1 Tax=Vanilla planifolia TaxID=51239 RepID=A0A835S0B6_VANPL|nr:hypothetical protein HPP92_005831 [Vanilla planifolia]
MKSSLVQFFSASRCGRRRVYHKRNDGFFKPILVYPPQALLCPSTGFKVECFDLHADNAVESIPGGRGAPLIDPLRYPRVRIPSSTAPVGGLPGYAGIEEIPQALDAPPVCSGALRTSDFLRLRSDCQVSSSGAGCHALQCIAPSPGNDLRRRISWAGRRWRTQRNP